MTIIGEYGSVEYDPQTRKVSDIVLGVSDQGCIFKSYDAYKAGNIPCYINEFADLEDPFCYYTLDGETK